MAKEQKKAPEAEDLLTSSEALAEQISKSEEFVKANKNILMGVLVAVVAAIGGTLFFQNSQNSKNEEALKELYPAEYSFKLDSTNLVLNGNDEFMGVTQVAANYSGTPAAQNANFKAGIIYINQGEFDKAIEHFKKFDADDLILQGRAYSLIGDAYSDQGKYDEAKEYYIKASNYKPNEGFTPTYIMKLAANYEMQKDYAAAVVEYEKLIKNYPKAADVAKAKKLKARASGLSKG